MTTAAEHSYNYTITVCQDKYEYEATARRADGLVAVKARGAYPHTAARRAADAVERKLGLRVIAQTPPSWYNIGRRLLRAPDGAYVLEEAEVHEVHLYKIGPVEAEIWREQLR